MKSGCLGIVLLSMLVAVAFLVGGMCSGDTTMIGGAGMYLVVAGFIASGLINN